MGYVDLLIEVRDRVALVQFNLPEKLNAFRDQTNFELLDALNTIERDEAIHAVILTGKGRGFCTGHDLSEAAEPPAIRLGRNARGLKYAEVCEKILHLRQPVVAAINGWCVAGGVGIAICSDILIASDDAKFSMSQIAYGYPSMPGVGAMLLPYVSTAWVKDMILGQREIDSITADRIGLVSRVVRQEDLVKEAWEVALKLAAVPPDIMAMQREMMNRVWLAATGVQMSMLAGRHTAIAGHSLPDWEAKEANWKTTVKNPRPITKADDSNLRSEEMSYRLGIDVGGTFTDLLLINEKTGDTYRAKVSSTPGDQSIGVLQGIEKVCAVAKIKPNEIGQIMHGTTVATNTVLEGKGAKIGLITTKGYEQVLQIGRSFVPGGLAAFIIWNMPDPLAPLELTFEVHERMSSRGEVVEPLDEPSVRKALHFLKEKQIEALTVSLVNSFANSTHEQRIKQMAQEMFPHIPVSISSEVLPEMYEYERTLTTVANSYVAPVVSRYIGNLQKEFQKRGLTSHLHILQSDGGLASAEVARQKPVSLLMSGPAGGVAGALWIAQQAGFQNILTFDMGGTSTDVALIQNGVPAIRRETTVGDVTIRASSMDVRSIGAGGGSVAHVPQLTKALRVGPQSAGAAPGPAAYGKGGTNPTVTDANVVLGRLPSRLAGELELDKKAAETAVMTIATALGLDLKHAASGIIDIVNENMFGALRLVSVEQGYDPRNFALMAFGGAGPLHANALGKLLGSWPVVIPPSPGVLCAQGDATTRLRQEASRTFIRSFSETSNTEIASLFKELAERAAAFLDAENVSRSDQTQQFEMDVRYQGQGLTLPVHVDLKELQSSGLNAVGKKFDDAHTQLFT